MHWRVLAEPVFEWAGVGRGSRQSGLSWSWPACKWETRQVGRQGTLARPGSTGYTKRPRNKNHNNLQGQLAKIQFGQPFS